MEWFASSVRRVCKPISWISVYRLTNVLAKQNNKACTTKKFAGICRYTLFVCIYVSLIFAEDGWWTVIYVAWILFAIHLVFEFCVMNVIISK